MVKDRQFLKDMLAIGRDSGCSVLLLTVDLPVSGSRYRDVRSGLSAPAGFGSSLRRFCQSAIRPRWAWDVGLNGRPHSLGNLEPVLGSNTGLEDYFGWIGKNFDASIGWKDLGWVRDNWEGPVLIKGILDPDDAKAAVAHGADGLVVSNHGGRQLDGAMSTARALPGIAEAISGKIPVLVDGGVRSGLDVVRMLALGADFVLMGRAWAYALAADGERGIAQMLKLVEAEMRVAMALTGCTSAAEIGRHVLA
jgi:L-lactate dehydrogenase (cytochrome)